MKAIDIDRFSGEAAEPPVWGNCSYCGAAIYSGYPYHEHEGLSICEACKHRYAVSRFEEDAVLKTAGRREDDYE